MDGGCATAWVRELLLRASEGRQYRQVDPTTSDVGATTQINYHYSFSDAPGWATAAETQNAYPQIRADLDGPQMGLATLTNTSNGWAVSSTPGNRNATTSADGKIVE